MHRFPYNRIDTVQESNVNITTAHCVERRICASVLVFCKSTERAGADALGVNLNTMGSVSIFEARGEALP